MKETTIPSIIKIIQDDNCSHHDIFAISELFMRIYIENAVKIGISMDKNKQAPKMAEDKTFEKDLKEVVDTVPEAETSPNEVQKEV